MGRIATSVTNQIQKLKDRGMEFDCEESKDKEILLDIGYYRLGFYWNPFEIDREHNFKEGTKFSNVVSLYYLDVDLRHILMRFLNRIEINFRTKLVYYASNSYKNSPTWFVDPTVVHGQMISEFADIYSPSFKKNHKAIKLHHAKYINDMYAPAWKTLEFFTFGTVLRVFKSLKNKELKERISKCYDIQNLDKFINLMETMVYVRNACAHGDVLFDLQTPKGISILPGMTFNDQNRHSIDSSIKVILRFLDTISVNRKAELMKQIDDIFVKHKDNEVLMEIIETKIGYKFD